MVATISAMDWWRYKIEQLVQWCALAFFTQQAEPILTDSEIIMRIMAWDDKAYALLVENRSQPLFRYLYNYCGYDKKLAEDALQEVFLHLRKNLSKYNPEKPFEPWIRTLARNRTIDRLSSYRRTVPMQYDPLELKDESQYTHDQRSIELVQWLLQRLPVQTREIIIFYYFEQYSYHEISEIMDVSINTVGTLLRRGKQKIKELIERDPLLSDALDVDLPFEND